MHADLKPYLYLLSKGLHSLCDELSGLCVLSLLSALIKIIISCTSTLEQSILTNLGISQWLHSHDKYHYTLFLDDSKIDLSRGDEV